MSRNEHPNPPTDTDLQPAWVRRILREHQPHGPVRSGPAAGAVPAVFAAGNQSDVPAPDLGHLLGEVASNWPFGGTLGFVGLAAAGGAVGVWHLKHKLVTSSASTIKGNRAEGLATKKDLRTGLSQRQLLRRATILRPSLEGERRWRLDPLELGLQVGVDLIHKKKLFISCEDAVLVLAPPRSGKTAWLGGHVLDAPGACLVTSTRRDIYEHTEGLRRQGRRPVWVFNGGIAGVPNTLKWNPVAGCHDPNVAIRRAGYLLTASASGEEMENGTFWESHSFRLLRSYLMTGALAPIPKTLLDVRRWVANPANPEPQAILEHALEDYPDRAAWLRGWHDDLAQQVKLPDRTRDSIYATLTTTFEFLARPQVADIVLPGPGEASFDARDFLHSRGTLYLMGNNPRHGSVAPLFACLVGEVYETVKAVAADSPQGRLDPPLLMVLDEAAVICPLPLHQWTADSGGWNIQILTSVQSRAQLFERWGGKALWENTNSLVFGGLSDTDDLEELSLLCGEKDEEHLSRSTNEAGEVTTTSSFRRVRVMPPAEIRGMQPFTGLYFHRALPPIRVGYTAVWGRKDVKDLAKARKKMAKLKARMEKKNATLGVVLDKAVPAGPPPMPTYAAHRAQAGDARAGHRCRRPPGGHRMTTTPPKRVPTLTERLDEHDGLLSALARNTSLLQKEMRELHEARLPQRVIEMRKILGDIAAKLRKQQEDQGGETRPWNWVTMSAREQAEAWELLLRWRREVLQARFPQAYNRMLAPCWYRHPDVVEELSALYVSWMYAYVDKDRSAFRVADFLDRRLPFTVQRVEELLRGCAYEGATHREPWSQRADHDDEELSTFLRPIQERAQREEAEAKRRD